MVGRREFGALGITAAAALALKATALAEDKPASGKPKAAHPAGHGPNPAMMMKCAEACSDCQRECDACSDHCAHMLSEGDKSHYTTLKTCQDCATVCAAAAQMVSRHGPFSILICKACAEACDQCATECEKFKDDEHMARCAEECRKCEKACKQMIPQGKKELKD